MLQSFLQAVILLAVSVASASQKIISSEGTSRQILPANFKPPQVFKNTNLVRTINLEKGYVKESINVVIQNTDSKSQTEYYIPFAGDAIGKVGGLEVRDKNDASKPAFKVEIEEWEVKRLVSSLLAQFKLIHEAQHSFIASLSSSLLHQKLSRR